MMTKADQLVDQAADRLQAFANEAVAEGGLKAKIAEPLAEDAALLRRMKPSLIKARIKGEAPTNLVPARGAVAPGGPNPFVVIGVAFVAGIFAAKLIDWRGHAHPRD